MVAFSLSVLRDPAGAVAPVRRRRAAEAEGYRVKVGFPEALGLSKDIDVRISASRWAR